MGDEVPNLRGSPMTTLAFIVGPLLGALMAFGGIVWQASKYPERGEFNAVRDAVSATKQDTALHGFRLDGMQTRLDAIDVKLDKLLDRNARR